STQITHGAFYERGRNHAPLTGSDRRGAPPVGEPRRPPRCRRRRNGPRLQRAKDYPWARVRKSGGRCSTRPSRSATEDPYSATSEARSLGVFVILTTASISTR